MTLRPADARERSCTDKKRLASEAAARALASHLIGIGKFTGKKAWVYPCPHCRGFHITSKFGHDNLPGAVTAASTYEAGARA